MSWSHKADMSSVIFLLIALLVVYSDSTVLPPPTIVPLSAAVWKCAYSKSPGSTATLEQLYRNGASNLIEVLHHEDGYVELIASASSGYELEQLGLSECTHLIEMEELITNELESNWRNLQHHVNLDTLTDELSSIVSRLSMNNEHSALRRSIDGNDKGCRKLICNKEWFSQYHNLSSMYQWYEELAEAHPETVFLNKSIGRSYYGRDIMALHFTNNKGRADKPTIYIQCLLHSREWISGSVCMYLSYRLATPRQSDIILLKLLSELEFVIVPVANPDGYFATWVEYPKYRLWRKNVQPLSNTDCAGVDLNRNFDSHWNQTAVSQSDDPCSELYHGPFAESECEVYTLTHFIKSLGHLVGAIDYHSYHQKILYPPAFSGEFNGDDRLKEAAMQVAQAASADVSYTPHRMYDLYSAAGTFADWLLDYGNDPNYPASDHLVPLTVELRPHPEDAIYSGFILPTNQIIPVCQEMFSSLLSFSDYFLI